MKATTEKSTTATRSQQQSGPFFAKAGGGDFFAPAIQTKLKVGKPGDRLEQEADHMADRVMRMPSPEKMPSQEERQPIVARKVFGQPVQRMAQPEEKLQRKEKEEEQVQRQAGPEKKLQRREKEEEQVQMAAQPEEKLQRKGEEEEQVQMAAQPEEKLQRKEEEKIQQKEEEIQRKGNGVPAVTSSVQTGITSKMAGGQALDTNTRSFMESRMNADFSNVRIHNDAESGNLNSQLSARAFTYQNHVFFNRDQYQPGTSDGKHLLAHELTHVVQQGHAVQRSPQVTTTATQPHIQRLGVEDALGYFANAAYNIPGYRMFTIVIGVNPINMQRADRSAANILRAIVEFLPGGRLITSVLDHYNVFERAGAYVEQQMNTLGITGSSIRAAVMSFLNSLGWRDIFRLGSVWERAKRIFTEPIGRILTMVRNLGRAIMQFIWDAVLRPLASLAAGTRGWDLVKAILGRDPITGTPYPRTPATLIGGFMRLIGQEEVWQNIQRGGAIQRAWAWFQGALSELTGMIRQIPTLFMNTLRSISIQDFLPITNLFGRIFRTFGNFVGNFIAWAGRQVMTLLEIIFSVVAPGAMPYLRRARGAFQRIIRNPMGFVRNLINAVVQGFRGFASRIGTHLRNSIVQWLTGAMAGAAIYIPRAFELREIVKFVFSVLGLTWQNIRGRLVRHLGEPAVVALETTVSVVRTLITQGPAAAWAQIRGMLGNLRNMVMTQIMQYVTTTIVQAAMTRLLTSLNPAGAFIQAIIAIYNTVMFLVERIRTIMQVGRSVLDSIMAIAAGAIAPAAQRVERTMAGMLTLVISFLARIAGLGRISDAVVGIIQRIRRPIDMAIDRVVAWLVGLARRFVRGVAQAGVPRDPNERLRLGMAAAVGAVNRFAGRRVGRAVLTPLLSGIRTRYGFRSLDLVQQGRNWAVDGQINPRTTTGTRVGAAATSFEVRINFDGVTERRSTYQRMPPSLRNVGAEGRLRSPALQGREIEFHSNQMLGASTARGGAERQIPSPSRVGLGQRQLGPDRYERAHGIGPGFGTEVDFVVYAPRSVNQFLQNQGIESYLREAVGAGVQARVGVTVTTHPGTMRIKSIIYRVQSPDGRGTTEIGIHVSGNVRTPRISISAGDAVADVTARLRAMSAAAVTSASSSP
ncbi:MAG: DUF4157 domain-containing protein [Saprospiraceae bacterium]|nr:DUF4157 domain-containing protein [Saprospiraceae bacterium]MCF8249973.1 DUF4157 domain-containing protein [Saprospiraceae bacterium]MCF8310986.1 DUF4157 domain-containing protein [Saprospiraceae bacterium]MCF8439678.1 DUF4157 domain-containing protein [Saprospiraceae bacterium]